MNAFLLALPLLALPGSDAHAATPACTMASDTEILALFSQWNGSLQSGDPRQVDALYARDAVLLPTLSRVPRLTSEARIDYFEHFLKDRPAGRLDSQRVQIGCDSALLSGLYTFDFGRTGKQVAARYSFAYTWTGERWLITSHHSSALPES